MPAIASPTHERVSVTAVPDRAFSYLRLIRPANLVTSAADILTAAVIVGSHGNGLPWLVGASICLYAGGVVLNDFFDRHLDAIERPERPIPAGIVSAPAAAVLGTALMVVGIACASRVSPLSAWLALLLAGMVLLYDAFAKTRAPGPFVMGACRAFNLLLGLSLVPATLFHLWFLALLPWVYIFAVTTLSRGEVHGGSRATSGTSLFLMALTVIGLGVVAGFSPAGWHALLPFAALLCLRLAPPLWRAFRNPAAGPIRAAVHAGIVSLVLLDAALAASFGGIVLGAAILSLSVLTAELARLFPVT
ncbi:MAG: UbiA-like protein EboC [Janthinobacterium lividum]